MLREHSEIDRHSRWPDVKKRIDGDARYRAVESSVLREDYFHDYCKILKEERRKQKDKERDRKERKEKEKREHRDKDRQKDKGKDGKTKDKRDKRDEGKDSERESGSRDDIAKSSKRKNSSDKDEHDQVRIANDVLSIRNQILMPIFLFHLSSAGRWRTSPNL